MLDKLWGKHTIDIFATDYNTKCSRFNSKCWCKNTEAIDAFSQNWFGENNWLVPPPNVVWLTLGRFVTEAVEESGIEEDHPLHDLVDSFSSRLLDSRRDSTVRKYNYAFKKWKTFSHEHNLTYLPASPIHVSLYLVHLLDSGATYSTINSVFYSIKWAHDMSGQLDPTENAFVKNIVESAKRTAKAPVVKKDPVSNNNLLRLCSMFQGSNDLTVVRDLAMILLSYSAFLRFTSPLADDSEDDRKILRAQTRAERKTKSEKAKKKRPTPYSRPTLTATSSDANGKASGRPGVCYNCYKPGHWKFECPEKKRKLSTNLFNVNKLSSICSDLVHGNSFQVNTNHLTDKSLKYFMNDDSICLLERERIEQVSSQLTVNSSLLTPVAKLKNQYTNGEIYTRACIF
ncbi:Hypothetical predicted protein [Mytilus galloprovincialis]|uniref:CCHC-type domain-containing protein n=1 Tax=Mytilus galloprovincialis TaxID=29158 RepID=A0A8B6DB81_MYTGA|nr:Hypothetical predicted protein [Mytilus galloprovincialis]